VNNNSQTARVERLLDLGFTRGEIASLTDIPLATVREICRPAYERPGYEGAAMLRRRTPSWWHGSREEYEACVIANFGDQTEQPC
jgi:hypothetical protein